MTEIMALRFAINANPGGRLGRIVRFKGVGGNGCRLLFHMGECRGRHLALRILGETEDVVRAALLKAVIERYVASPIVLSHVQHITARIGHAAITRVMVRRENHSEDTLNGRHACNRICPDFSDIFAEVFLGAQGLCGAYLKDNRPVRGQLDAASQGNSRRDSSVHARRIQAVARVVQLRRIHSAGEAQRVDRVQKSAAQVRARQHLAPEETRKRHFAVAAERRRAVHTAAADNNTPAAGHACQRRQEAARGAKIAHHHHAPRQGFLQAVQPRIQCFGEQKFPGAQFNHLVCAHADQIHDQVPCVRGRPLRNGEPQIIQRRQSGHARSDGLGAIKADVLFRIALKIQGLIGEQRVLRRNGPEGRLLHGGSDDNRAGAQHVVHRYRAHDRLGRIADDVAGMYGNLIIPGDGDVLVDAAVGKAVRRVQ